MKPLLCLLVSLLSIRAIAQFPYHPLPWKQSDFKTIKQKGYTVLKVYAVSGEEKNLATIIEYGSDGLMATQMEKGTNDAGDSITTSETSYRYDGKGRLSGETTADKEYGESLTAYTYDATGKLVKKEIATIDPPTYKYKYNAAGKLSEVFVTQKMAKYEEDGEWKGKTFERPSNHYVYKYDAKGRLSEEWDFQNGSKEKTPDYKITWTYNNKGQVIKVRRTNSEGTEMYVQTYEYNAEGLVSKSTRDDGIETITYTYEYCKGCKQSWMEGE